MKKQFRHSISILLALALVLSCVPMAISVAASTAALPGASIKNGGFEKGDFTNWTTDSGAFSIDGSGWRGNYCLKATGSGRLNQTISVERNTDYKIEYINKLQTDKNTDQGIIEVYTKDFSTRIASGGTTVNTDGWNTTRFTFNSGNRDEVIISIRGVKGTCWYDEIYILKSNNLLVNGDFSTATYARWVSADNKNTTDAWCVQDDPFEEGGYCLAVGNGVTYSRKLTQRLAGLSTNSDYILTFYSKGCTGSNRGQIKVTNDGETAFTNGNVSAKGSLDTWKKSTYKFNTGSNTVVKVFIQSIDGGTVYFDKIALVKATTATITADEGGTVSSDDIVSGSTELNSKMTVTATPSAGCTFAGWYNGNDELVSTDESYTFKVTSAVNLTAKFESSNFATLQNPDFENPDGAVSNTYGWYDVQFATNEITTAQYHSGEKSLRLVNDTTDDKYAFYQINGLAPNTAYTVRFYAKATINGGYLYKSLRTGRWDGTELATEKEVYAASHWTEYTTVIPSSNTSTVVYLRFRGKSCEVYIDDITVARAVTVTASAGENGSAAVKNQFGGSSLLYGDDAVFTATPDATYGFTGWYDGEDALVSTDATYTISNIASDVALTAKFAKLAIYKAELANTDFEEGTGSINNHYGWSSITSGFEATITDSEAHSGEQSLKLQGSGTSYKHAYLKVTVNPERAYKLRYYVKTSNGNNLNLQIMHTSKWSDQGGVAFVPSQGIGNSSDWSVRTVSIPANNVSGTIYLDFFSNATIDAYIDDITVAVENTISVDTNLAASVSKGYVRFSNQYGKYSDMADAVYLYGDIVNLHAYPDYMNKLLGWKFGGASEYVSTEPNYSFELNGNTSIVAEFGFDGLGDFDGSGTLNATDLTNMKSILLGISSETEIADVNADENINILDLISLKKRVAGIVNWLTDYGVSGNNGYLKQLAYTTNGSNKVGELIELSTHINGITSDINVFDADEVDLSIALTKGNKTITVPGFYYKGYETNDNVILGANGESDFRFRFTLPEAGVWNYTVSLSLDGTAVDTASGSLTAYASNQNKGYITTSGNRFAYGDGTLYTPIGQNIAYSSAEYRSRASDIIEKMEDAQSQGANFTRVWASQWSIGLQKQGYAANDFKGGLIDAVQFDKLFDAADELDMSVQLSLFVHTMFRNDGTNQSGWKDCAYNSATEGGVIANPQDFFTDSTAKKQTKDYLRYMVARYGYSENLFAWELMNEADSTTGYDGSNVAAWYTEMTAYLKSIDPYTHMVTSSATGSSATKAAYNSAFDFASLHLYYDEGSFVDDFISSRIAEEANASKYDGKPVMFGELGYLEDGSLTVDSERMHRQLWATLMSCGGAGASWQWNTIAEGNLYTNYVAVSRFASYIDFANTSYYNYNKAFTSSTNAFGYIGTNKAYLWIYGRNAGNFGSKSYTVSGLTNGTYTVRWYNTISGELMKSETVTASGNSLTLTSPAFTNDIAVRVTPNS